VSPVRAAARSGKAGPADWWQRAHPRRATEEAELSAFVSACARWRAHPSHGTPQTLLKARALRQGTLARLYEAGHLSLDQLAWSAEIRAVRERIGRAVGLRTLSLETRVDNGCHHEALAAERLGQVRAELAYGQWRAALAGLERRGRPVSAAALAVIGEDLPLRRVARAAGMRDATLRGVVSEALDLWPQCRAAARRAVDAADLVALHQRLS
jgi:hypothetical protein